jgi:hypothetical protein
MVLIVMLIAGTLWLTLRRIIGVVHLEAKGGRGLRIAGNAVVHQGARVRHERSVRSLWCSSREHGGARAQSAAVSTGPRSTPSVNLGAWRRGWASCASAYPDASG